MKQYVVGPPEQFDKFPAEVELEDHPFFLMKEEGDYKLMSRVCPHAGYTVDLEDGELVCPLHGWTFETETGRCHNVPNAKLPTFEIILQEGTLIALVP